MALVILMLPLLATAPTLAEQDVERGVHRLTSLAFGLWYLPVSLSLLVLLAREPRGGPGLLLALGLAVALSDIGAFTLGRLWGRRPLAARLSPSKTLAGAAGNIIGAALGLGLLHPLAPDAPLLALLFVVAIGALWGDLLESLLKRNAGAKDAGQWLPGFGGMLDRADSLLVVLPLAFVVLKVS
jgi:phosphatidate cytidylyltransferase